VTTKKDVCDFFSKLTSVMYGAGVFDELTLIHNVDETVCLLNNRQSLKVAEMGSKMVEQQVCVESGETVTIVANCGAIGRYVPSIKVKNCIRSERADFHQGH
jgi:hypothetical protein